MLHCRLPIIPSFCSLYLNTPNPSKKQVCGEEREISEPLAGHVWLSMQNDIEPSATGSCPHKSRFSCLTTVWNSLVTEPLNKHRLRLDSIPDWRTKWPKIITRIHIFPIGSYCMYLLSESFRNNNTNIYLLFTIKLMIPRGWTWVCLLGVRLFLPILVQWSDWLPGKRLIALSIRHRIVDLTK